MKLFEVERLELMELATSKKLLSSKLTLDYETIHNLYFYGGKLFDSFLNFSVYLHFLS